MSLSPRRSPDETSSQGTIRRASSIEIPRAEETSSSKSSRKEKVVERPRYHTRSSKRPHSTVELDSREKETGKKKREKSPEDAVMPSSSSTSSKSRDSSSKHQSSSKSKSKHGKSDDWSDVTEPEERRRIQNRLAQRKFRRLPSLHLNLAHSDIKDSWLTSSCRRESQRAKRKVRARHPEPGTRRQQLHGAIVKRAGRRERRVRRPALGLHQHAARPVARAAAELRARRLGRLAQQPAAERAGRRGRRRQRRVLLRLPCRGRRCRGRRLRPVFVGRLQQ